MNLPPFTLYGLIGCPHCEQAEQFLRTRSIPALLMISNEDPIIAAGIKEVTGSDEFPVLVSRLSSEVIKGFKSEDYDRVTKIYFDSVSAGASGSVFAGQQPLAETANQSETAKTA